MKYFIILIILFVLNFCHADSWRTNAPLYDNPLYYDYYSAFEPNPLIFITERYINDLGHEFPIQFFIEGTYWKGGAWGSRNGFSSYYGNEYFTTTYYSYQTINSPKNIPEPCTLFLLGGLSFLLRKNI